MFGIKVNLEQDDQKYSVSNIPFYVLMIFFDGWKNKSKPRTFSDHKERALPESSTCQIANCPGRKN